MFGMLVWAKGGSCRSLALAFSFLVISGFLADSVSGDELEDSEVLWGALGPEELSRISEASFWHAMQSFDEEMAEEASRREFQPQNLMSSPWLLEVTLPSAATIFLEWAKRVAKAQLPLRDAIRSSAALRGPFGSDPMERMREIASGRQDRNRQRILRAGQRLYGPNFAQSELPRFVHSIEEKAQRHIDARNGACGAMMSYLADPNGIRSQQTADAKQRILGLNNGDNKRMAKERQLAYREFMASQGYRPGRSPNPLKHWRYHRLGSRIKNYDLRPGFWGWLGRIRVFPPRLSGNFRGPMVAGEIYRYPWRDFILPAIIQTGQYSTAAFAVRGLVVMSDERRFFEGVRETARDDYDSLRIEGADRINFEVDRGFFSLAAQSLSWRNPELQAQESFHRVLREMLPTAEAEEIYSRRLREDLGAHLEEDLDRVESRRGRGVIDVLLQNLNPETAGASWAIAILVEDVDDLHRKIEGDWLGALETMTLAGFEMEWVRDPDVLRNRQDITTNTRAGWRWRRNLRISDLPKPAFDQFVQSFLLEPDSDQRYQLLSELMEAYGTDLKAPIND